jgi:hypothetical protein
MSDDKGTSLFRSLLLVLVAAVLAPIGTLVVEEVKHKEAAALQYVLTGTPEFQSFGPLKNTAIYTLEFVNTGDKEAIDLSCAVEFPGNVITGARPDAPKAMRFTNNGKEAKQGRYTCNAPVFNPNDRVKIAFIVDYSKGSRAEPQIDIRAKGETAERVVPEKSGPRPWLYWYAGIMTVAAVSIGFSLWRLWRRALGQPSGATEGRTRDRGTLPRTRTR